MKDATIKKLQDLNIRHQEKLYQYEENISRLNAENSELKEQLKKLQSGSKHSHSKTTSSKTPDDKEDGKHRSGSQHSRSVPKPPHTKEHSKHSHGTSQKSGSERPSTSMMSDSSDETKHPCKSSSLPKPVTMSPECSLGSRKDEGSSSSKKQRFSPLSLCETLFSDIDDGSESLSGVHEGKKEDSLMDQLGAQRNEGEGNKPLLDGVDVSPEVWSLIQKIKSGEKGDLRFIKDLTLVAFGPEVLASSSIKGTKRGHNKEGQRPALNGDMLKKIFNCLEKRVQEEIGGRKEELASHHRLTTARFHSAIRQLQKKVRADGYGVNKKTNEVTADLMLGDH